MFTEKYRMEETSATTSSRPFLLWGPTSKLDQKLEGLVLSRCDYIWGWRYPQPLCATCFRMTTHTKLYTVPQECLIERRITFLDHLAFADAAQDPDGLLHPNLLSTDCQVNVYRAAFQPVCPQLIPVHGVIPPLHMLLLNFMRFLSACFISLLWSCLMETLLSSSPSRLVSLVYLLQVHSVSSHLTSIKILNTISPPLLSPKQCRSWLATSSRQGSSLFQWGQFSQIFSPTL